MKKHFKAIISGLLIICMLFLVTLSIYKTENKSYIHISFDDTFEILKDLTINEKTYDSIFDNETLAFLHRLHKTFGAVFSMYCFYENGEYNLSQFTDSFSEEFSENSDWLKFGFHSYNPDANFSELDYDTAKEQYTQTTTQLKRIVGDSALDDTLRLHNFAGNAASINAISSEEIDGLFTADDDRISYDLNESDSNYISNNDYLYVKENNVHYISTDLRLERTDKPYKELNKIRSDIKQNGFMEVFTHEYLLSNKEMKTKLIITCFWAMSNGYTWAFPNSVYNY